MEGSRIVSLYVIFVGFAQLEAFVPGHSSPYNFYNLASYCGSTLTLPCDQDDFSRAGTLSYSIHVTPPSTCEVRVILGTLGRCTYNSAIYFNIKKLRLPAGGTFVIGESSEDGWTEKKRLTRSVDVPADNQPSAAQFRSAYNQNPHISLSFQSGTSGSSAGYFEITLEYSIYHTRPRSGETYCEAVSGYMLNKMICEADDRIICPATYNDTTDESNPATGVSRGTPTTCREPTSGSDMPPGTFALIGIIGSGIALTAAAVVLIRRRLRRRAAGVIIAASGQPAVTTGYPAAYPAQQPQHGIYPNPLPPAGYPTPYPYYPPAGQGHPPYTAPLNPQMAPLLPQNK